MDKMQKPGRWYQYQAPRTGSATMTWLAMLLAGLAVGGLVLCCALSGGY